MGVVHVRRGATTVVAVATALALPGAAAAASDTIRSPDEFSYAGGTGPGGAFLLDAGSQAQLLNDDPTLGAEHNVVAEADGPDGERLFATDLILAAPAPVPVRGTEYLTPGDYAFECTIHFNMKGTLRVSGAGALPRPQVDLEVVSSKLRKVRRGKLEVAVTAATRSDDVSLLARVAGKALPAVSGVDLAAGATRRLTLKLPKPARKAIKDAEKAKVTLGATVPFGAPAQAKRTLR